MGSRPSGFSLTRPGRVRLYSTTELIAMPAPAWLIDPIMPAGGLVGIYGAPGTGKSFLAVDLALSVATGRTWHGAATQSGFVVYISAEGGTGIGKRARTWLDYHHVPARQANAAWLTEAIPVQADSDDIAHLFDRIQEVDQQPTLVIIDTLARCFEGDENQQEDMGRFIGGVDKLRHNLGAAVVVIHHTRLDGDRERGNTAFRGAADTMIAVKRPKKAGPITVECVKQKDAEEFASVSFRLHPVPHEDTRQQSCIIEPLVGSGDAAMLVATLQSQGVSRGTWDAAQSWQDRAELPRSTFYRVLKEALKQGLIRKQDNQYQLV